jgi:acid phosphatase
MRPSRTLVLRLAVLALAALPLAARAEDAPPPHDLLNATLWMQRSVEYRGHALGAFALARMRLDEALADKSWTAAPAEQAGAYQDLPPAIVVDLDETLLDNSAYQAWMVLNDKTFASDTWRKFVFAQVSGAIEGAVDFAKYADSKGVKVFYISNRVAEEEEPTRKNMERLGFPMGGNVDVFLMARKRPEWGSAKGTRRAHVAKDYRILLNLGDNFGDFVDAYRTSEAERQKVFEENRARWGREWIVLANPAYGSFEVAPFTNTPNLPPDEQRRAKRGALDAWTGE